MTTFDWLARTISYADRYSLFTFSDTVETVALLETGSPLSLLADGGRNFIQGMVRFSGAVER